MAKPTPLPYALLYLNRKPLGEVPRTAVHVICERLQVPADVVSTYDHDCARGATLLAGFVREVKDERRPVLDLLLKHLYEPGRQAAPYLDA